MKPLKWQFGLGAMLFATLCIAGYFAGYRYGGEAKDREIEARDRQIAASTISTVCYDVREFLDDKSPKPIDSQLWQICDLLTTTIEPGSWRRDERDIRPYPQNYSIIVRQTGSCHAEIANMFEDLRTLEESHKTKR